MSGSGRRGKWRPVLEDEREGGGGRKGAWCRWRDLRLALMKNVAARIDAGGWRPPGFEEGRRWGGGDSRGAEEGGLRGREGQAAWRWVSGLKTLSSSCEAWRSRWLAGRGFWTGRHTQDLGPGWSVPASFVFRLDSSPWGLLGFRDNLQPRRHTLFFAELKGLVQWQMLPGRRNGGRLPPGRPGEQ